MPLGLASIYIYIFFVYSLVARDVPDTNCYLLGLGTIVGKQHERASDGEGAVERLHNYIFQRGRILP